MRKLLFLLFALFVATTAVADDKKKLYDKAVLTLVDGRVFDIDIDTDSYIYSYIKGAGEFMVQYIEVSGKSEVYLFERSELMSMKFVESKSTDIDDAPVVDQCNPMRYIDNELVFHSILNGETLYVYDMAGKSVMTAVVDSEKNISLAALAKGRYLVKVKDCEIKVLVR